MGGSFYKWSGGDCEDQYHILFFEQSYNEWTLKTFKFKFKHLNVNKLMRNKETYLVYHSFFFSGN